MNNVIQESPEKTAAKRPSIAPSPSAVRLDLNLEELPWFVFSKKHTSEIRYETGLSTPEGNATMTWIVRGGPLGLPSAFEQDVYVALSKLYSEQGMPEDGVTWFSLYRLGKTLGMGLRGHQYKHLERAIQKLGQVYFESHGAFFSKERDCRIKGGFPLFSKWNLKKVRAGGTTLDRAFVQFNQILVNNLRSLYVKEIDLDFYLSLEEGKTPDGYSRNAVAKKLYRLLNRRRMDALVYRVELMQLARMIPLFQAFPSQIRRVVDPANELLVKRGFLREVVVDKDPAGNTYFVYEIQSNLPRLPDAKTERLLMEILDVLKDEHSLPFYKQVAQTLPHHIIRRCLAEVRVCSQMGEIRKSAGALFVDLLRRSCLELRLEFPWGRKNLVEDTRATVETPLARPS